MAKDQEIKKGSLPENLNSKLPENDNLIHSQLVKEENIPEKPFFHNKYTKNSLFNSNINRDINFGNDFKPQQSVF